MHTEGILLQSTPFLDRKAIFKIFTHSLGLISCIATARKEWALLAPFCIAEWTLKKGAKELYLLQDASLCHPLLELRHNEARLFSAGTLARSLLQSQINTRSDPLLYQLTVCYLKQLLYATRPETLAASFQLKVLLREGLFELQNHPQDSSFSDAEWEELVVLAGASRFSALTEIVLPKALQRKIELLFESRIK